MSNENILTLRQLDQACGDLYAIADELQVVKVQIARLRSNPYLSRTVLIATASICALVGAVVPLLMR